MTQRRHTILNGRPDIFPPLETVSTCCLPGAAVGDLSLEDLHQGGGLSACPVSTKHLLRVKVKLLHDS